jgi:putative membrane protein
MKVSALILFASLALAPACAKKKAEPTTPEPPAQTATGAKLDDAQIAAIVVAANQVDIDAGNLAVKKTKNPEVKKFAELMVTDHTAVNKSAVDLVTKLKVTPTETDTSRGLVSGGSETRAKLEALDGDAFDKAYVDNEVAYHEAVIGVLKTTLIPSATNQELKDALVGVQPAFDAHLQHAKQLQASLDGGASAAHAH